MSSLTGPSFAKWVWYAWSCVAFLGVLYLLWGRYACWRKAGAWPWSRHTIRTSPS
ncbi:hypothetical protein QP162_22515 [Sphingomonas aurantiaca]